TGVDLSALGVVGGVPCNARGASEHFAGPSSAGRRVRAIGARVPSSLFNKLHIRCPIIMSKITDFFPQKCRNPTSEFSDTTAIPLPDRAENASQPAAGIQEPPQKRAKKYLSSVERFPWLERVEESSTRHVTAYRCRTCVRMGLQGKWGTIPMLAKGSSPGAALGGYLENAPHNANYASKFTAVEMLEICGQ
ncbi:hypothetical protein FOZ62_013382, partial [Perkinsus olseni]